MGDVGTHQIITPASAQVNVKVSYAMAQTYQRSGPHAFKSCCCSRRGFSLPSASPAERLSVRGLNLRHHRAPFSALPLYRPTTEENERAMVEHWVEGEGGCTSGCVSEVTQSCCSFFSDVVLTVCKTGASCGATSVFLELAVGELICPHSRSWQK